MIQKIRTSKAAKVIACYLALMMILQIAAPIQAYALTEGPSQPEFNSFTPIGTSDMVNLTSGDFNYNVPVMDIGGYPINLAYDSGVTMDQEASWVGLGWNLNVGQITRDVRGIPDEFNGDEIRYENNLKKNKTVGMVFNINPQFAGLEALSLGVNAGLTVEYNNYEGVSFTPSYGFSFEIAKSVQVGMNLSTSATQGVSVNPNVSYSARLAGNSDKWDNGLTSKTSIGLGYNSRQGLSSFNMSSSLERTAQNNDKSRGYKFNYGGAGDVSFVNNTFTPSKRNGFKNTNFLFSISGGPDFWSIDAEAGITAYGTFQEIKDKNVTEKAYGYENTHNAGDQDILDFNRENDRQVSKNTLSLPIVNYTYDLYSIQSQSAGGMFRPFRGQAGYVFDKYVSDNGSSESLGGEIEGASGFHVGFDYKHSPSSSHTGAWNTLATSYFKEQTLGNELDYETIYYKSIGEHRVDQEAGLLRQDLGGYNPVRLKLNGSAIGKYAGNKFIKETYDLNGVPYINESEIPITGKLKRTNREVRSQAIQKITVDEVNRYYFSSSLIKVNPNAKGHHTAAIKVLNGDGSTHIFGETAYNIEKREATFAVNGSGNCQTGKVSFTSNENSISNGSGVDNYFNRVTTPEYAHTYLISAVLSPDYEDLTGNGLSIDDLGSYTKFNYVRKNNNYNWRVPYTGASFNAGLNSHPKDQKGSYVYGRKELKYIQTIETKTHVAYFKISERKDALGANGENGNGINTSNKMYKLDKIYLFSKPEYEQFRARIENTNASDDPTHDEMAKYSIKIAHFSYYGYDEYASDENKTLCKGIENSINGSGKLTLHKVYFTYRNSNMGKYTPYTFYYDSLNPNYHIKSYDLWGNYKPLSEDVIKRNSNGQVEYDSNGNPILNTNSGVSCNVNSVISTPEYPFVRQQYKDEDKILQDAFASAWSLTSIVLPSGGKIQVEYESDDYQYVQDRKAMQMFTVTGAGTASKPTNTNALNKDVLYEGSEDAKFLYVRIPENTNINPSYFKEKYIGDHLNKPIYFNFMLNMSKSGGLASANYSKNEFDYVSGYFNIDTNREFETFSFNNQYYASIPMKFINMEGGLNGSNNVNPISKAGWYFARANLNRLAYGLDMTPGENVESIARALVSSIGAISEIFSGPNGKLRNEHKVARRFIPHKSWIRLLHPNKHKLGGGARVKTIKMHDNWDKMLEINGDEERYANVYGQEYKYILKDGGSSGVATYEPIGNKENPFVEPFYDNGERLVAPREMNYVEIPFGESFFPSPSVTYSRVEVKNLLPKDREVNSTIYTVKKHATGKVISEFYTSKDFPTRSLNTKLDGPQNYYSNEGDFAGEFLKSLVGAKIETQTELTLSQGFVIHTNDMNGKEKSQEVYNEAGALISKSEYIYSTNASDPTILENNVPTLKINGELNNKNAEVGVHYDVVTDFRESYSNSKTFGVQGNLAGFVIGIFPIIIPMGVPDRAEHTSTLHTTTTTKVIHTTGILKEKIVYDLGSRVSTKNLAWDGKTGEVLLTETINEYDDKYYTFSYPAYWKYNSMGMASENIDIKGRLIPFISQGKTYFNIEGHAGSNISKYLKLGDELLMRNGEDEHRLWVVEYNASKTGVRLMDRDGSIKGSATYGPFRVYRSGYRNQQTASMASVTLMVNPLADGKITEDDFIVTKELIEGKKNRFVINANAIEFNELWAIQCENRLPTYKIAQNPDGSLKYDNTLQFNPYVYNLLGEWRAVRSYAYLTGRYSNTDDSSPRKEGFYKQFSPYYVYDKNLNEWVIDDANWTFASEITMYSPYGPEVENRDALNRFSAAQYGYNYLLPVAVGSNSMYAELGFDGFEDYSTINPPNPHFAFYESFIPQQVTLSNKTSHTGNNSIAIQPGQKASFVRKINGCKEGSGGEILPKAINKKNLQKK